MKVYQIDTGDEDLKQIKETHDFEQMNQRQYKHMMSRMRQDLIATQITANELHEAYK